MVLGQRRGVPPGTGLQVHTESLQERDVLLRPDLGRAGGIEGVDLDGSGLEPVTTHESFDGFPMFSPDGRSIVWASNRHDAQPGETNLLIAEWVQ